MPVSYDRRHATTGDCQHDSAVDPKEGKKNLRSLFITLSPGMEAISLIVCNG